MGSEMCIRDRYADDAHRCALMRIAMRISAYADHPHEPHGSATAWPSLISITKNVKSYKKFTQTAQTSNFSDFPLILCRNGPKGTKTMLTQTLFSLIGNFSFPSRSRTLGMEMESVKQESGGMRRDPRDPRSRDPRDRGGSAGPGSRGGPPQPMPGMRGGPPPVSYTHLTLPTKA